MNSLFRLSCSKGGYKSYPMGKSLSSGSVLGKSILQNLLDRDLSSE